jgi:hypothetical protein
MVEHKTIPRFDKRNPLAFGDDRKRREDGNQGGPAGFEQQPVQCRLVLVER